MNRVFDYIANRLIERAKRTPYTHIYHPDGSLYMGRFWLVPFTYQTFPNDGTERVRFWRRPIAWVLQRFGIAVRVHHLVRPDRDPHMHDHPWDFWSLVLHGWYIEMRPINNTKPCFKFSDGMEEFNGVLRATGSFVRRKATDRHRICEVSEDAWTLFVTFRKVHWWGFYTPAGKVYWRDYESQNQEARTERT